VVVKRLSAKLGRHYGTQRKRENCVLKRLYDVTNTSFHNATPGQLYFYV